MALCCKVKKLDLLMSLCTARARLTCFPNFHSELFVFVCMEAFKAALTGGEGETMSEVTVYESRR